MTQIRINTDQVRETGRRLSTEAERLAQIGQELQSAIGSLDTWAWDGRSRARAAPLLGRVRPENERVKHQLEELGYKLVRVADIFEQEDNTAARNLDGMPWVDFTESPENSILFPILIPRNHVIYRKEKHFQDSWKSWTVDERLDFLRGVYGDLAEQYDLTPVNVKSEDLPDKKILFLMIQDAKGVYRDNEIAIDIDNLSGSNGTQVLKTLIHETRHQIQAELVQKYKKEGNKMQLPPGISLDQVKAWEKNTDPGNYIQPTDDYQDYRKQPIEQDARDFADDYYQEALPDYPGIQVA